MNSTYQLHERNNKFPRSTQPRRHRMGDSPANIFNHYNSNGDLYRSNDILKQSNDILTSKCHCSDPKCLCSDPKCHSSRSKCECSDPKCHCSGSKCLCSGPKCHCSGSKYDCSDEILNQLNIYYKWLKGGVTKRKLEADILIKEIKEIFEKSNARLIASSGLQWSC